MRPLSYWPCTFVARASCSARISAFWFGAATSEIAIVTPERVAQRKPASFRASSDAATSTFGYRSARSLTMTDRRFLSTTPFSYG
ncbi:hypothetical protein D3C75_1192040 [compost metagenome]